MVIFLQKNTQKHINKKQQAIPKPNSNCCAVFFKFKAPQACQSGLVAMLAILSADNGDNAFMSEEI